MSEYPFFLAGGWERSTEPLPVEGPYDGAEFGRTWLATASQVEAATEAALRAAPAMRNLAAYERAQILSAVSADITARRDELARVLAHEAAKPIKDARTEIDRGAMTFKVAAEEALRIGGEVIPLDVALHGKGRWGLTRRFPIGPVAAISPFNFPFNLTAHKLAPAIAAGNPIVLKPASKTPLSALMLAAALDRAGVPPGGVSVLPMTRALGDCLVTDDRYKLLTFTGSSAVGWAMKARAGRKRVLLELGGNAGVIVDETADLDRAVQRIAVGGFAFSGQSCISVQRVFVAGRVFDEVAARLVARVEQLKVGDPLDPATDLGPMIDASEAERVDAWVREAVQAGASVLTGGKRIGRAAYAPTVLTGVPPTAKVCAQEVFAPLVGLYSFEDFRDALAAVNDSSYGLQAGIFTNDLSRALAGYDALEVGGVIVNDVPTYRIDHMPYGGVKDSGLGREGPRYTIEEMTELKLLVIST
jgi:glyceraldehyde-3-phosphate dehydrogenase (NADP+)